MARAKMLMMVKAGAVAGSATHSEAATKARHGLVLSPIRPIDTKWMFTSTVGLLARGSNRTPAFPAQSQWHIGRPSPPTVAGAASDLDRRSLPNSLLSPRGDHGRPDDAAAADPSQSGHKDFFISPEITEAVENPSRGRNCPLTRLTIGHTTYGVSWSPGSQGRVIIGKPVRAIAPVRRCPRNCDSRCKPASQIPATTG